jgi:phage gpG-like protein
MTKISVKIKGTLNLNKKGIQLANLIERGLPKILGNEAVNFSKKAFKQGGWTDKEFKAWKPRKNEDAGRAILVQTGDLRRSIVKTLGNKKVVISTNVTYAAKHNFGKGKLPKRQFMGESKTLEKNMQKTVQEEVDKILNS